VGVNRSGAFAEYLSSPVTNVWYGDPAIPTGALACFARLGNGAHTKKDIDKGLDTLFRFGGCE